MRKLTQYAIIDGASEEALLNFLAEHNPPHSCLYAEPLQQELVAIAPYLVQVTEEVSEWLADKVTPWGIYVSTPATMKELRQHLRKYLQIIIPGEEKPVFFRFYDPRNVWDFCSVLSDWELHCFMGPVAKISTNYDSTLQEESFEKQREQFPSISRHKFKMFKLDPAQLEKLNQMASDRYLTKLIRATEIQYGKILTYPSENDIDTINPYDKKNQEFTTNEIVKECYYFCKQKKIDDDRSIRGLLHLFMEKRKYTYNLIPDPWIKTLSDESQPGFYRVETLLMEFLGYIPR